MLQLSQYIQQFKAEQEKKELGKLLEVSRQKWDTNSGGNSESGFKFFVEMYNFLGQKENKKKFGITENLARNLPGAVMQDWLVHFALDMADEFPRLRVFTEVRVPFGNYPLWRSGEVSLSRPAEKSDVAIGYMFSNGAEVPIEPEESGQVWIKLPPHHQVLPLVTINSKIRVSQSEFFDFLGRETLMTKGNPHCYSIQVALRKEMDADIVDAAQAEDKWFLLGAGGEGLVVPNKKEFNRLKLLVSQHLAEKMKAQ